MIISGGGRWEAGRIFQVLPSQDKREFSGARTHSNMVCNSIIKAFSHAFDSKFTFQEFITRALPNLLSWECSFTKYKMEGDSTRVLTQADAATYLIIRATCKLWHGISLNRLTCYTMQVSADSTFIHLRGSIYPIDTEIRFRRREQKVQGEDFHELCTYFEEYNLKQLVQVPQIRLERPARPAIAISSDAPGYRHWKEYNQLKNGEKRRRLGQEYMQYFRNTQEYIRYTGIEEDTRATGEDPYRDWKEKIPWPRGAAWGWGQTSTLGLETGPLGISTTL